MKDYYELIPNKTKEEICNEFVQATNEIGDLTYSLLLFCNNYNLVFDVNLVEGLNEYRDDEFIEFIKRYIRNISSLPQYKGKIFRDSIFKKQKIDKEFNLINTLKIEQELLVEKIAKTRDKGDYGSYKNLIVALRDIARLIHDEEFYSRKSKNVVENDNIKD